MTKTKLKEKAIGFAGSVSGFTSIFGSWQVCHNICLGLIVLLGAFGITAAGMPLLFLTKLAVPFWIAAFLLLLVIIWLCFRKKCISSNLILFNSGLIIAGIPFQSLQGFSALFWTAGGTLVAVSVFIFIKNKLLMRGGKR